MVHQSIKLEIIEGFELLFFLPKGLEWPIFYQIFYQMKKSRILVGRVRDFFLFGLFLFIEERIHSIG